MQGENCFLIKVFEGVQLKDSRNFKKVESIKGIDNLTAFHK